MSMRRLPACGWLLAAILCGCAAAPEKPAAPAKRLAGRIYGDAGRGRAVAERWCIGCHRLDEESADDRVPSFPMIAANPSKTEPYIRAFLQHPHSPMPPLELSNQIIEDIIAYLRTLAPRR